jgi:DNA-binding transcriptional regulator YdaS (Cro superfamily)
MARLLGIAQPSVWYWLHKAKPLPAEHVLTVEAATGISRHDLRPDIYPRDLAPVALAADSADHLDVRP